jgi:8-oxo-dGTP pyrophosphatase MutT (NUDIX family)
MRDRILERLAGTRPPADPVTAALDGLDAADIAALFPAPLVPAAVLVPLIDRRHGLSVLFTRRADQLRDHPGQISFPGGRVDPGDASALHTALREAEEEIGLDAAAVRIAGYLRPHAVVTGFAVTPVVGLVTPPAAFRLDAVEVAEVFEVPLAELAAPGRRRDAMREIRGVRLPVQEYHVQGRRVWGATAAMLAALIEVIK